jgi:hypothetical protein
MILKRLIGSPVGVAKSPVSSNFQECRWDRLAVAFDLWARTRLGDSDVEKLYHRRFMTISFNSVMSSMA